MKNFYVLLIAIIFFSLTAKAQIIYTDVKPDKTFTDSGLIYHLDLNNDGITDFNITCSKHSVSFTGPCFGAKKNSIINITPLKNNAVLSNCDSCTLPLADTLGLNYPITQLSSSWSNEVAKMMSSTWICVPPSRGCTFCVSHLVETLSGFWGNATDKYLAMKLIKGANTYFGWARLSVSDSGFTIKDYAYNSKPNEAILAGQKTNFIWIATESVTPLKTQYCRGDNIKVKYSALGTFNASNIFKAQLSDSTGSFAHPVLIGSIKATGAGTVSGKIPAGISPGIQYRIRVVSTNPHTDSLYPYKSDLTIGANITAGVQPTTICKGNYIYLYAPDGYTYQWLKSGKIIQDEKSYSLLVTTSGNYSCIFTGACGVDTSNTITVKVNSVPQAYIIASDTTTFCKGGSVTLNDTVIDKGYTYQWNSNYIAIPGATKSLYVADSTAYYSVTVTNAKGCSVSSNTISVTVPEVPQAYIYINSNNGDSSFCTGSSINLLADVTNGDGVDVPFQYQWKRNGKNITGATYNNYWATDAGTYTCKVTNICGSNITKGVTVKTKTCSQTIPQKTIGGSGKDFFTDMCSTRDGGIIAGGTSYSTISYEKSQDTIGNGDYWIVKMDKSLKIQWSKTIGGSGNDNFKSVIQTSDGGYALIGESSSNISGDKSENSRGLSDYWLVKLDSMGNIQWNKTIGGNGSEYIDNIVQTKDSGYILAGSSDSKISGEKSQNSRGGEDYWIVKLDKHGKEVWDRTVGGNDADYCSPVALTNDGGIIVGGLSFSNISGEKTENSRGGVDYWLVKLDNKGNKLWDKTIGGNADDYCHGLYQTADSGFIIAGSSLSGVSGEKTGYNRGGADYWILKLDKNRKIKWQKTIGGSADDWLGNYGLIQTKTGGYILAGSSLSNISGEKTESSRGGADYWAVNLNHNGDLLWDKTIGGYSDDWGNAVIEPVNNKFFIGGSSASPEGMDKIDFNRGNDDYWIVKLNYQPNDSALSIRGNNFSQLIQKKFRNTSFMIYPNPVSNSATISFSLPQSQKVSISIYDVQERLIKTLADSQMQPGAHELVWNGRDENGNVVNAGIYFLKMQTDNYTITKKLVVVK